MIGPWTALYESGSNKPVGHTLCGLAVDLTKRKSHLSIQVGYSDKPGFEITVLYTTFAAGAVHHQTWPVPFVRPARSSYWCWRAVSGSHRFTRIQLVGLSLPEASK